MTYITKVDMAYRIVEDNNQFFIEYLPFYIMEEKCGIVFRSDLTDWNRLSPDFNTPDDARRFLKKYLYEDELLQIDRLEVTIL